MLLRVFYALNATVFGFVVALWIADLIRTDCGSAPANRLITPNVVLALIAASTAQLGALVYAVGRQMFRPRA